MSLHKADWLKLIGGAALALTGAGLAGAGPLAAMLGSSAGTAGAAGGAAAAGAGAAGTAGAAGAGAAGATAAGIDAGTAATTGALGGASNMVGNSLITTGIGQAASGAAPKYNITPTGQAPALTNGIDFNELLARAKQGPMNKQQFLKPY